MVDTNYISGIVKILSPVQTVLIMIFQLQNFEFNSTS
jgi:hypothetical protein